MSQTVSIIRNDLSSDNEQDDDVDFAYESSYEASSPLKPASRMDKVYVKSFAFVSLLGIHVFVSNDEGDVHLCPSRCFSRVLVIVVSMFAGLESGLLCLLLEWPMWFIIMTLPFWYCSVYTVGALVHLSIYYKKDWAFMESIIMIPLVQKYGISLKICWFIGYIIVFIIAVSALVPKSRWVILSPIFVTLLVPTLVDIKIGLFSQVLAEGVVELTRKVKDDDPMTLSKLNSITADYQFLRNTLSLFNEVSKLNLGFRKK